jgi:hypothetical protein
MKGPGRHEGGLVIQNAVVRQRDRFRPESGGIVFNAECPQCGMSAFSGKAEIVQVPVSGLLLTQAV